VSTTDYAVPACASGLITVQSGAPYILGWYVYKSGCAGLLNGAEEVRQEVNHAVRVCFRKCADQHSYVVKKLTAGLIAKVAIADEQECSVNLTACQAR